MSEEVTIDEDAKSRLEELQDEIRAETGQLVTQQEIVGELINDAYENTDEIIDTFRESTVPLSKAETEAMSRGRFSSGVETDEEDIDEILYG
ncbi:MULTISPECIES: hypothetical protein [Halobacterium]|uniref:hypothetical protein n=1 Tax=Halobacterium TaxID=2239 RepID=UPI00073FA119|nr:MULTISPECIES: hypothetical protein [Halobacterium]MCG1002004.1 hypothetical protein [Halobacterium noricense]